MGFTFSHPALIFPFKYLPKKYYSLNGLVVGSIIPDFEYFIRLDSDSVYSHTISGLFWFDLPLAILALFFFHLVIRDLMIGNLPYFLKSRLLNLSLINWIDYFYKNWIVVIFSILTGSLTHLFWDSFTSFNGYFVINNSTLLMKTSLFGVEIFNYKILKHASSLLGGIFLIYQLLRLPKQALNKTNTNKHYWIIAAILFSSCILFVFTETEYKIFSFNTIIKKSISCWLFALILTSLYFKTKMHLNQVSKQ